VPAVCILFGLLLVVALLYARQPASIAGSDRKWSAGSHGGSADGGDATNGLSIELTANDPVVNFTRTRTGQLLYASRLNDNCRRVLFDNKTGDSYDVGDVFCGQALRKRVEASGSDRINALRKSFQTTAR
jgi:hypothetical protein